jgi:hypothetical protein
VNSIKKFVSFDIKAKISCYKVRVTEWATYESD